MRQLGRGVTLGGKLPFVMGPVEIHVGNGVFIGGNVVILSGYIGDERLTPYLNHRNAVTHVTATAVRLGCTTRLLNHRKRA
jgi:acetyltransferase-like isoleucine patch superfamily enzyme